MDLFWSKARFDLRLSDVEFYSLTPKQFVLLMDRHREHLIHTEGLFGQVAAMIGNHSMMQPEKPYSPYQFMPNYKRRADDDDEGPPIRQTPEMIDAREDFQQRALQLAAEMKQGQGPLYDRFCLGKTDG